MQKGRRVEGVRVEVDLDGDGARLCGQRVHGFEAAVFDREDVEVPERLQMVPVSR